jgi:hypothetical protein
MKTPSRPPLEALPEALPAKDHAAIAKVAALRPVNATAADLAAQCIAAQCIAARRRPRTSCG